MKIYKNVCAALDLIDNDNEWHIVFTKATLFKTAIMLRNFMITILIECSSVQSARLWKIHKNVFSSDCKKIIDRDYQRIFKFDSKTSETLAHQNQQLVFFYWLIYWIKYRLKSTRFRWSHLICSSSISISMSISTNQTNWFESNWN